ncbi:MAG: enoyl-CoA hydratase/isomerase family protein [Chloroflexi bacterium]|nr:enoyl-CoA hydratase/isomerase family protein [Chloroflexota bacterium]MCC6892507.1 enoyl-CoA hydratase/isomerase family protein [Anaerolineae bacterium]
MNALIQTQQRDTIFEIIFNRPDKRNAINWAMMTALDAAFDEAEKAVGVRAVIIRGEGTGFSAGIDVTSFIESSSHFGDNWRENLFPLTAAYQAVTNKIERCSLPTIALLHGYCLGLGFEIALACDFRIAAVGTRMGLPETRLGIIPDVGGTTRLTRLVGAARSKEYVMTGKNIDFEAAERWGLLNRVVTVEDLLGAGEALVAEIAQAAPLAVQYTKRVIDGMIDVERGLQLEGWAQSILIRTQDFEAGIEAMLTKQPPQWKGK